MMEDATKEVGLSAGTIRYRDVGKGPVLLFVHGAVVDGNLWAGVVEKLAGRHRCVVPDWPIGSHRVPMNAGADLTPRGLAGLVIEFMAALDLREVTLIGNDSGGAISQLVAGERPERLGRLVLTNCDAFEVFPPPGFEFLAWVPRLPVVPFLMSRALLHVGPLRRLPFAYGALTVNPIPDELLRRWVEPGARDGRIRRDFASFARGLNKQVTLEAAERLKRFDRPALLLWGREDRFFPLELGERLARTIPGAELVPVAGGATFLPLDRPEAVAAEIARFVAERSASPALSA